MTDNETSWDKLLQIKTCGRDDTNADEYRYPYEPTPYCVFERLAGTGPIGKDDTILGYGYGTHQESLVLSDTRQSKCVLGRISHFFTASLSFLS